MDHSPSTHVTATQARQRAQMHATSRLGTHLGVGQPIFEEERRQWRVPIHSPLLDREAAIGEIVVSAEGRVVQATSREVILAELERRRAAGRPAASVAPSGEPNDAVSDSLALNQLIRDYAHEFSRFSPAPRENGFALRSGAAPTTPVPPVDLEALGRALEADNELATGLRYLLAVLRNPAQRDTLLNVLASFASSEEESSQ
jgi:hypothetical protein